MMSSASSPPPPLPITSPVSVPAAPAAAGSGTASDAPVATPAFRLFITRLNENIRRSFSDRRPWTELSDRSAFSRPESLAEATSRLRKNVSYFRVNYAVVIASVLAVSLITNPFSIFVLLILLATWCLLYLFRPSDQPLVLFGRTFSDRETLLGLVCLSVLVVFLTSVGSVIISALVAGTALVGAHGALRVPEDLFLDDQDIGGPAAGLLSFLGGPTSVAGPPTVAPARV